MMHSDIFKNCINFQFSQKEIAKVELLIVPKQEFNNEDKYNILQTLNNKNKKRKNEKTHQGNLS